ncbi:MAG: sulfatase-like hydrolase/transferase [Thermoanaerobaculia bacterium]
MSGRNRRGRRNLRGGSGARNRAPVLGSAIATLILLVAGCGRNHRGPAPSVLLVTLDTTRADHAGAYGSKLGATPHLDALAARGAIFEHAYAVAPLTLPAHASLLTGRLPTRTGLRWNGEQKLANDPRGLPTLAERFRAGGYTTGAFVSASVLDHAFGLERGFSTYDDRVSESTGAWKAERAGQETVRRAIAWLGEQPAARPVFLWVHLYEAHEPYLPPTPFAAKFPGDPYSAEIATADDALGRLLDTPRFRSDAGAIVSVIGDHGESLGEHGEATHGVLLYDGTLHVPWVLAAPGEAPRHIAEAASQVDLAPTLLALAHQPALAPSGELDGTDLSPLLSGAGSGRPRTLYAESLYASFLYGWSPLRSTRRGAFKWIAGARNELFDIGSDPGETKNLAAVSPEEAGALARALEEIRSREVAGTAPAEVDAALAASLRNLGYLSGAGPRPETSGEDPRDRIALHERLRAIDGLWQRGDVDGAQRELDEVFAADPGNRLVQRVVEQQVRTAIADLVPRGAEQGDTVLRLRIRLAQLLAGEGRRDEARELLETASDSPAQGAVALNVRAFARLELGRKDEARADWTAILRGDLRDPSPALNLATLALGEGQFAEAERWAKEAVTRSPRSPAALNALGIALEQQGRPVDAEARYRAALAADPAFFRAELNLGLLLAARGTSAATGGAVAALEDVLRRSPQEPLAHLALGKILVTRPGNLASARQHLEAFLALSPQHPRAGEIRELLARLPGASGSGG